MGALMLAAGLSGCGGDGPYFLDARQELAVSRYQDERGDRAAAIAAAQRAAEVAQNDVLRLRALRRTVTLTSPENGGVPSAEGIRALETAALLGDKTSLEKLAALRGGYQPSDAVLARLVPLLQESTRGGSARAPLLLADLAAAGRIAGGKTASTAWMEIAASRGSAEARKQLAVQYATNGNDAAALLHMTLLHSEARPQSAMRIASGFLEGKDGYPQNAEIGARFATIAAQGDDGKSRLAAAGLARRLLTGADGVLLDPDGAAGILAALDKSEPALATKLRVQAGLALLTGKDAKQDVARAVALLEGAAGGGNEAQDAVRGATLRLAEGRDGAPRDVKLARRLMAKLTSRQDRKLALAAIEGRKAGSAGESARRSRPSSRTRSAQRGKATQIALAAVMPRHCAWMQHARCRSTRKSCPPSQRQAAMAMS